MNHESGITNHGRGAVWLIRLGAFLVASLPPLQHLFLERWASGAATAPIIFTTEGGFYVSTTTWYRVSWPAFALGWLLTLAWVASSVLATRWGGRPGFDRATLIAFLPLSATLSFSAASSAEHSPLWGPRAVIVPPGLAAFLPAAGAVAAIVGYVIGVSRPTLARWARRWLAGSILWITLLPWNSFGFGVGFFPGWVGAAGAAMILLGEFLARPVPVILDS